MLTHPYTLTLNRSISMTIYTHKHHIIPKHMGGTDDPSNLIVLTIEEHAQAHLDLYNEHGYTQDHVAYRMLLGQINKAEAIKILQKAPKSLRWKSKMSKRMTGENNPNYGGGNMSDDARARMSERLTENQYGSKHYIVTDPEGSTHEVYNLAKFCREHNLDQGNMVKVSKSKCKQHKGWLCQCL